MYSRIDDIESFFTLFYIDNHDTLRSAAQLLRAAVLHPTKISPHSIRDLVNKAKRISKTERLCWNSRERWAEIAEEAEKVLKVMVSISKRKPE